jgi:hypothetical protein
MRSCGEPVQSMVASTAWIRVGARARPRDTVYGRGGSAATRSAGSNSFSLDKRDARWCSTDPARSDHGFHTRIHSARRVAA